MGPGSSRPLISSIPSSDRAFRTYVLSVLASDETPADLERRLRRLFPRVVVRERAISGEPRAWYVYRDGRWRPPDEVAWWNLPGTPRVVVSHDGWITEVNALGLSLLGLTPSDIGARHVTDLVAPWTAGDVLGVLATVLAGHDLDATVLLRPASGDVIAVDLHAAALADGIEGWLRLADDVDVATEPTEAPRPALTCRPEQDVAFRGYAQLALSRMPDPTPEGLALRLRRLYPHATVAADGVGWIAARDADGVAGEATEWWRDPTLPMVRYDAQALILEANQAASELLGAPIVGHYWQEYVTPGSTEQVSAMLAILAEVGAAESRFRMPNRDGALIEFDSYTSVEGETFTTIIRLR